MKKALSVLLAALMLAGVMPLAAFAAGAAKPAVRFILKDGALEALDFSDLIQDADTINIGLLELINVNDSTDEDSTGFVRWAQFDKAEPGRAVIGAIAPSGDFVSVPLTLGAYNYTYSLRPKTGKLYDDVASYSFTVKNVYDSTKAKLSIMSLQEQPTAAVTKITGKLVKEITFDFNKENADFLPDTVDLDRVITLGVFFSGVERTYTVQPIRFEDSVLTVMLLDDDEKIGVPLHNYRFGAVGGVPAEYLWSFVFDFPEDMFSYNKHILSQSASIWYNNDEIVDLPIRAGVDIKIPSWIKRLGKFAAQRMDLSDRSLSVFGALILPVLSPFSIFRILRGVKKSFSTYDLDFRRDLRVIIRDLLLRYILRGIME